MEIKCKKRMSTGPAIAADLDNYLRLVVFWPYGREVVPLSHQHI